MFEIRVKNSMTKEVICFTGQGTTLADAVKDGLSLVGQVFRPKNDGQLRTPSPAHILLPDGRHVNRSVKDFEGDTAFSDSIPSAEVVDI